MGPRWSATWAAKDYGAFLMPMMVFCSKKGNGRMTGLNILLVLAGRHFMVIRSIQTIRILSTHTVAGRQYCEFSHPSSSSLIEDKHRPDTVVLLLWWVIIITYYYYIIYYYYYYHLIRRHIFFLFFFFYYYTFLLLLPLLLLLLLFSFSLSSTISFSFDRTSERAYCSLFFRQRTNHHLQGMKKRSKTCGSSEVHDDAPLGDLQVRLNRLKLLVPERFQRHRGSGSLVDGQIEMRRRERLWARRVQRRMQFEETCGDDSKGSTCSVDDMMAMLNQAEAISSALASDFQGNRPNPLLLNKVRFQQKKLLEKLNRKHDAVNMHDETYHCHRDHFSDTDYGSTDSDQNATFRNDRRSRNSTSLTEHTTDRIQQGINRLLNDQVHLSDTINRLSDERSRIQSYLHNIYSHDSDAGWHRRQSNVKNHSHLPKTIFDSLSKWKVKRSMEYFDCPICLMK